MELFEELISYLQDNFISYKTIENGRIVEINGQTYELFEPFRWEKGENGTFFDQCFHWACDKTEEDNYIFRFGSVWYFLKKGNENAVKLERVKWLGKADIDEELKLDSYLGVHGAFELLNGVNNYVDWCKKAKFLGIKALGICEKNTLAGAMKFQTACQNAGIRPIQGMEIVIANEEKDLRYTVKAFVKNKQGWQNLLEINKILNVDKNQVLREQDLPKYREGLFIIVDPKTTDYDSLPLQMKRDESLYYQLDTVVYEKEDRDKKYLQNLKKFFDSNLLPIAMCDAYYLEKEWGPIRKKLNSIAKVVNYESNNQYFKSYFEYFNELEVMFPENDFDIFYEYWQLATDNLNYIALNCNFEIETQVRHMPSYYMTDEEALQYEDNKQMFEDLIYQGVEDHPELLEKYGEDLIAERLDNEITIIEEGGVEDYFLTLRDIINFCKREKILLGSGRGSSAGSLVAYLLGLVNINPLDYDLLFSRFLTRGRLIRHEKIEEIIINQEDKDPIRIKSNDFVRIFRGEKEMIVKGNELQEGDNLVDYDNKINP